MHSVLQCQSNVVNTYVPHGGNVGGIIKSGTLVDFVIFFLSILYTLAEKLVLDTHLVNLLETFNDMFWIWWNLV